MTEQSDQTNPRKSPLLEGWQNEVLTGSVHNPTFFQKLLGRHYKWWYIAVFHFKLEGAYFVSSLLHFFGQSISVYTAFLIWYASNPSRETLTSLIVGLIIFAITNNTIYWNVGGLIESGKLSKFLISPSNFFGVMLGISFGFAVRIITYYIVILTPIFMIFSTKLLPLPSFSALVLIFLISLIVIIIRFLLACIVGFTAFWTTQVYGQSNFYENLLPLLGGVLFPYQLITEPIIKNVLIILPWSFIAYHPMQIYLGKYSTLETFYVFLGGLTWCFTLYFLAKWVFKMGLKKNEAVGL